MDEIKEVNRYSGQQEHKIVYRDPHARKRRRHSGSSTTATADSVQEKPQQFFDDKVDNSHALFAPKFANSSTCCPAGHKSPASIQPAHVGGDDAVGPPAHPFHHEISQLPRTGVGSNVAPGDVRLYTPLAATACTWVATEAELKATVAKLQCDSVNEIAVDLEAHSYRSFQGFVCLMQLSTRFEDFLVDTLALRSQLHLLLPVFTDSRKVKVLHGSDSDILWLQRDFGLYIVNLFDTGQAARVLELQRFSLAHLLKKYCDVDADKKYQLADWRKRPLSEEMLRYAREDTHYLLYIYDRLRAELLRQSGMLESVVERSVSTVNSAASNSCLCRVFASSSCSWWRAWFSRAGYLCNKTVQNQIALRLYAKPVYTNCTYMKELTRRAESLPKINEAVFARLHCWRDEIARQYDESCPYVLPTYMLFRIAEQLPLSEAALMDVARPLPPLVQHHAKAVVVLIQQVVSDIHDLSEDRKAPDISLRGDSYRQPLVELSGSLSREELLVLASDGNPRPLECDNHGQRRSWFPTLKRPQLPVLGTILQRDCGGRVSVSSAPRDSVLSSFKSLEEMAELRLREAMSADGNSCEVSAEISGRAPQDIPQGCRNVAEGEAQKEKVTPQVVASVVDLSAESIPGKLAQGLNGLPASMADTFKCKAPDSNRKKSRHKRRRANQQREAAATSDSNPASFNPQGQGVIESISGAKAPRTWLAGQSIRRQNTA